MIIKNARIVNENQIIEGDLLIKNNRIEKVGGVIESKSEKEIDAKGNFLLPGIIDDQVHFREPGLTHKANIASEAKAAVAGGTTSFMEMPNTKPASLTKTLLQEKYKIAQNCSPANFSFFMGASNDNYDDVMQTDIKNVCGIKIFMGSSTGNMLVDEESVLSKLFANAPTLIATHCEDETTVQNRKKQFKEKYGENATAEIHPQIRNVDACYLSSSKAVELAKKHNTRLHILHISTAKELQLFTNKIPLKDKRITSEVCVHHLSFDDSEYKSLGNKMICNPAIKSKNDQNELWKALINNQLDIVATDHAPHTFEEKSKNYFNAPSGLPLVQHSLVMMMQHYKNGKISIEKMVEKMCHAVADCFKIEERGYLREGYFADLVLVKEKPQTITKENILYKCAWSPLENRTFDFTVDKTIVNGNIVFDSKTGLVENVFGQRLKFDR